MHDCIVYFSILLCATCFSLEFDGLANFVLRRFSLTVLSLFSPPFYNIKFTEIDV